MPYNDYKALRVESDAGVAWVTIDHPPINLFDLTLMGEIARLGHELYGILGPHFLQLPARVAPDDGRRE